MVAHQGWTQNEMEDCLRFDPEHPESDQCLHTTFPELKDEVVGSHRMAYYVGVTSSIKPYLWYRTTSSGFLFPVPVEDVIQTPHKSFSAMCPAIAFTKWIRRHIQYRKAVADIYNESFGKGALVTYYFRGMPDENGVIQVP